MSWMQRLKRLFHIDSQHCVWCVWRHVARHRVHRDTRGHLQMACTRPLNVRARTDNEPDNDHANTHPPTQISRSPYLCFYRRCNVDGCPFRINLSRADPALVASRGTDTSMSFHRGTRLTRGLPPEPPVSEGHSGNTEGLVSCCHRHPFPVKCPRPISISLSRPHANLFATTRPHRPGKRRPQAFPTSRKSNHSHSRPEFPVGLAGTLEGPPAYRQATTPRPPRWRGRSMSSDVGIPSATSQADRLETLSDTCHQGRRPR